MVVAKAESLEVGKLGDGVGKGGELVAPHGEFLEVRKFRDGFGKRGELVAANVGYPNTPTTYNAGDGTFYPALDVKHRERHV